MRRRATWVPAAVAPHDRPGGRRQTTRVARRRRSRTHRPRAAALADAHRCDAVVPRVSSSMSRGRRAEQARERARKKVSAAGRDCGARMPPTPVLCGIGCQRAASRPRPSSSAAAGPQLDAGCACPCAAQSARRKRAEGGGGPAVADRQHRACSSPAAAADGRRATGESRWPGRAVRQPATVAPPPRGRRPDAHADGCRCKVIGRARAVAAAKQDPLGGARASRAPVPLPGDGRLEHDLLRPRTRRQQHETPVPALVSARA